MSRPGTVAVLMYHATPVAVAPDAGYDPHYAVPLDRFSSQIDRILASGRRAVDVREAARTGGCAITFDDGDATNLDASRVLAERGATADFFVNSSTLGTPGHLDRAALRRMVDAGMSIQSHGHTHRYFDELSHDTIRDELRRSKSEIEDATGRPVVLFAPPGGRLRDGVLQIALELGYEGLCSSRAGVWRVVDGLSDVPRLAVLHGTAATRLDRWVRCDAREIGRMRARAAVLSMGKRALGNGLYDRMRAALMRG
jgi:peptidoglycan/xylan/chitin deacetylase (PgdA/CDA1 family)